MKKSMLAKLLIVMLCLSLVLCGCGNTSSTDNGSDDTKVPSAGPATPEEIADKALEKTLNAMFGDMGLLESDSDYGKFTLSVGEYVDNVMYVDAREMYFVDELSMDIEGVELDVGVYVDTEDLIITLPGVLDDAYGISFDTLESDMESSELWTLLGVDYDEFMAELEPVIDQLQDTLDDVSDDGLEDVLAEIKLDYELTEGQVTVDGQKVDAIIATFTADEEYLMDAYAAIADYIEGMGYSEEMVGELSNSITELEQILEDAELDIQVVVNINAETGYIMNAEFALEGTVEDEEGGYYMTLDLGVDVSKSNKYTLRVSSVADGEEMDVLLVTLTKDISADEAVYELSAKAAGVEVFNAELVYDKDSYEYELAIEVEEEKATVKGAFKLTDKKLVLSVDSLSADGENTDIDLAIELETISADSIPAKPKYTNIFKMSEDELMDILTALGETFGGTSSEPDWDDYEETWDY